MVNEEKYLKGKLVSPCNNCIAFKEAESCGEDLVKCRKEIESWIGEGWFEQYPFGRYKEE